MFSKIKNWKRQGEAKVKGFIAIVLAAVLGSYFVLAVLPDLYAKVADNSALDNATGNDFTVDIIKLVLTFGGIILMVSLWFKGQ